MPAAWPRHRRSGRRRAYFDSHTMRLYSWSSLQVSFSQQGPNTDPCQPLAQGGYLDPDNQLIRVQIAGVDSMTGNPTFLWGFDDASFLYRISVDSNNPQNLVFENVPVDSSHQPQNGQVVEVLRTAADLPNSGEIASLSGFFYTLDKITSPNSRWLSCLPATRCPWITSAPPHLHRGNCSFGSGKER